MFGFFYDSQKKMYSHIIYFLVIFFVFIFYPKKTLQVHPRYFKQLNQFPQSHRHKQNYRKNPYNSENLHPGYFFEDDDNFSCFVPYSRELHSVHNKVEKSHLRQGPSHKNRHFTHLSHGMCK